LCPGSKTKATHLLPAAKAKEKTKATHKKVASFYYPTIRIKIII
jgi:hypothetical protein